MKYYIAVDIGGTQIRAASYSSDSLTPMRLERITTQHGQLPASQETVLERIRDLIISIWPTGYEVTAISVAAPGPVDPYRGIILEAPNIPGWENVPLRRYLNEHFNAPIVLGNDANLAALGEWKFGAGQGHHHMIYITVSTGIGAGVIIDDHLLLGAQGLAAELGHITILPDGPLCGCGQRGHLEALSSGTAIANWVQNELAQGARSSLTAGQPVTAKSVSMAAGQGDALCIQALQRAGSFLGLAVANFMHIFNPTALILGGGVSQSGSLLLDPMKAALQKQVLNPNYTDHLLITTAAFGDEAGLIGALALGRTHYPPASQEHQ